MDIRKESALQCTVIFHPVNIKPPEDDEEYLVFMFKENVQDGAFTVAHWVNNNWFPDNGDGDTITHWARLPEVIETT